MFTMFSRSREYVYSGKLKEFRYKYDQSTRLMWRSIAALLFLWMAFIVAVLIWN